MICFWIFDPVSVDSLQLHPIESICIFNDHTLDIDVMWTERNGVNKINRFMMIWRWFRMIRSAGAVAGAGGISCPSLVVRTLFEETRVDRKRERRQASLRSVWSGGWCEDCSLFIAITRRKFEEKEKTGWEADGNCNPWGAAGTRIHRIHWILLLTADSQYFYFAENAHLWRCRLLIYTDGRRSSTCRTSLRCARSRQQNQQSTNPPRKLCSSVPRLNLTALNTTSWFLTELQILSESHCVRLSLIGRMTLRHGILRRQVLSKDSFIRVIHTIIID